MSMPGRGKMCFPRGNRRWEIEDHCGNNQSRNRSELTITSVAERTASFRIPSSYLGAKACSTHLYCIPPILPLHVQKCYHFQIGNLPLKGLTRAEILLKCRRAVPKCCLPYCGGCTAHMWLLYDGVCVCLRKRSLQLKHRVTSLFPRVS